MGIETAVFASTSVAMFVGTALFVWLFAPTGERRLLYYAAPAITLVAGVAYGLAALGAAGVLGSVLPGVRYVDWVITTPLIVYVLASVAGADDRTKLRAGGADAAMIVLGYVATVTAGALKWVAFIAASAAFGALVYYLVRGITDAAAKRPPAVEAMFLGLRDLTVFLWSAFPVLWLLGPYGFGVLTLGDFHFLLAILDVTSKVGFTLIVAVRTRAIADAFGTDYLGTADGRAEGSSA